jgi:hypothetical protein
MEDEIHVGDSTTFRATVQAGGVVVNVSQASVIEFYFKRPDGVVLTKTASDETDGSDGKVYYTCTDELSMPGNWSMQAHVVLPEGEWKSNFTLFEVKRNLA